MLHLRTLPLACALVAMCVLTVSCGSGNNSKFRLVHAIPDGQPVDVLIDGKTVESTVPFDSVTPSGGYASVSSGSRKLEVRPSGSTVDYFSGTPSFSSGSEFTVVATGAVSNNTVVAPVFTDNNTAPASGNAALRFIHASPSGPTSIDIYAVAPGLDIAGVSPSIAGLTFTSASTYLNVAAGTFDIVVTPAGFKSREFTVSSLSFTAGQIRTFVILDVQNGGVMSATPLELNDLN